MPTVRLVSGDSPSQGRVEVLAEGVWYAVCDDTFDDVAASVACSQLGFEGGHALAGPGSPEAITAHNFGMDTEVPAWPYHVKCVGGEASLLACAAGNGTEFCGGSEFAGITCDEPTDLTFLVCLYNQRYM